MRQMSTDRRRSIEDGHASVVSVRVADLVHEPGEHPLSSLLNHKIPAKWEFISYVEAKMLFLFLFLHLNAIGLPPVFPLPVA